MKFLMGLAVALSASAVAASAQQSAPKSDADQNIVLTGCVLKGSGGYVVSGPSQQLRVETMSVTPGTNGTATELMAAATSSAPSSPERRTFYLLNDDDKIKDLVGQWVEVTGNMKGDVDSGEIEVEIEQGLVELEFKVDGKQVTLKVPPAAQTSQVAGTSGMVAAAPVGTSGHAPDRPVGTSGAGLTVDAVGTTGVVPEDKPKDVPFVVRKIDVKSARMLAPTCDAGIR